MKKIISIFAIMTSLISCKTDMISFQDTGSYDYEITNDNLFKKTYLYNGFGYMISDLELESCGLKLIGGDTIKNKKDDFIITLNYPILEVLSKSKRITNEGAGITKKKALEVILNKAVKTNKVYIYRLKENGKYRLLFG